MTADSKIVDELILLLHNKLKETGEDSTGNILDSTGAKLPDPNESNKALDHDAQQDKKLHDHEDRQAEKTAEKTRIAIDKLLADHRKSTTPQTGVIVDRLNKSNIILKNLHADVQSGNKSTDTLKNVNERIEGLIEGNLRRTTQTTELLNDLMDQTKPKPRKIRNIAKVEVTNLDDIKTKEATTLPVVKESKAKQKKDTGDILKYIVGAGILAAVLKNVFDNFKDDIMNSPAFKFMQNIGDGAQQGQFWKTSARALTNSRFWKAATAGGRALLRVGTGAFKVGAKALLPGAGLLTKPPTPKPPKPPKPPTPKPSTPKPTKPLVKPTTPRTIPGLPNPRTTAGRATWKAFDDKLAKSFSEAAGEIVAKQGAKTGGKTLTLGAVGLAASGARAYNKDYFGASLEAISAAAMMSSPSNLGAGAIVSYIIDAGLLVRDLKNAWDDAHFAERITEFQETTKALSKTSVEELKAMSHTQANVRKYLGSDWDGDGEDVAEAIEGLIKRRENMVKQQELATKLAKQYTDKYKGVLAEPELEALANMGTQQAFANSSAMYDQEALDKFAESVDIGIEEAFSSGTIEDLRGDYAAKIFKLQGEDRVNMQKSRRASVAAELRSQLEQNDVMDDIIAHYELQNLNRDQMNEWVKNNLVTEDGEVVDETKLNDLVESVRSGELYMKKALMYNFNDAIQTGFFETGNDPDFQGKYGGLFSIKDPQTGEIFYVSGDAMKEGVKQGGVFDSEITDFYKKLNEKAVMGTATPIEQAWLDKINTDDELQRAFLNWNDLTESERKRIDTWSKDYVKPMTVDSEWNQLQAQLAEVPDSEEIIKKRLGGKITKDRYKSYLQKYFWLTPSEIMNTKTDTLPTLPADMFRDNEKSTRQQIEEQYKNDALNSRANRNDPASPIMQDYDLKGRVVATEAVPENNSLLKAIMQSPEPGKQQKQLKTSKDDKQQVDELKTQTKELKQIKEFLMNDVKSKTDQGNSNVNVDNSTNINTTAPGHEKIYNNRSEMRRNFDVDPNL